MQEDIYSKIKRANYCGYCKKHKEDILFFEDDCCCGDCYNDFIGAHNEIAFSIKEINGWFDAK